MSITAAQVDIWRQARSEDQRLEFKEAKTQFDFRKLCHYCVALANEGGGHLLFGIADKPPRPVVGTKAASDPIGMAESLFQKVGFRVDVHEVAHPDGRVVVFQIPSRPRGTAWHFEGSYLMRCGQELVPMSEDKLRAIFTEGQPDWLEESSRKGFGPQQVIELLDTQALFRLLQLPQPTDDTGILERLEQERLIDKEGDRYSIRRVGALLLARNLAEFPDVARKAPRVVVYTGPSKLETKQDKSGGLGYAAAFQGLVKFVMNQLPRNEVIRDALREDVKLIPEEAIRELIANALIHQDFQIGGTSIMVEIYSDRIEISNPGEPLVPVERFIDAYQSRNERLAGLMRRMRICEEKSSGIDRVVDAAEAYQLPAPKFHVSLRRTVATVYGPRSFEEMDRDDRIRACYQHAALKWVMNQRMTNQSLRDRFKLPESKSASVSQVISATMDAGMIKPDEKVGASKRFARYLPFWA